MLRYTILYFDKFASENPEVNIDYWKNIENPVKKIGLDSCKDLTGQTYYGIFKTKSVIMGILYRF